jgi:hypothetical protein
MYLAYMITRFLLSMVAVLVRGDVSKDVELRVPRALMEVAV